MALNIYVKHHKPCCYKTTTTIYQVHEQTPSLIYASALVCEVIRSLDFNYKLFPSFQ